MATAFPHRRTWTATSSASSSVEYLPTSSQGTRSPEPSAASAHPIILNRGVFFMLVNTEGRFLMLTNCFCLRVEIKN